MHYIFMQEKDRYTKSTNIFFLQTNKIYLLLLSMCLYVYFGPLCLLNSIWCASRNLWGIFANGACF